MTANFLTLQNVGLRLGRSPRFLLKNISFELKAGEVTALLGHRGSGKTLLLKLLNGLNSPSQGEILWQGQALSKQSTVNLRRQIAWLPQQPRLLGMTARDAIAYPLQLQGLSAHQIQQRMETWLETLGIPLTWLDQQAANLPQPAAQAIALTRALVMEPQLLLLDNPWPQSLDPTTINGLATEFLGGSESSPLAHWEAPQDRVKQALSKLSQRGGSVLWAMTAEQASARTKTAMAQRLLCLTEGKLTGNHAATADNWKQLLENLAQSSSTRKNSDETEEWD